MSKDSNFFEFDRIVVATHLDQKAVDPAALSFDKKCIYAGKGNWKLNISDLTVVEKQISERDEYHNGGGCRSADRGRSASRGRSSDGIQSENVVTLFLAGNGKRIKSITCTVRIGRGTTAARAKQLEVFIDSLKSYHRKYIKKHGGNNPYANTTPAGKGRGLTPAGQRNTAKNSRNVVTPARTSSSLYMSPMKKTRFNSPSQRRSGSFDGSPHVPVAKTAHVTGNVVRDEMSSPNAKMRLDLPPKSPLNTSPVKLRNKDGEDDRRPSAFRRPQLSGISGGNIKLKKRIDMKLMNFDEDESTDEEQLDDAKGKTALEQTEVGDGEGEAPDNESENVESPVQDTDGEEDDMPRRRRLQKARSRTKPSHDNDDSDVEFEMDEKEGKSSCRKKLQLSIDDDEDDEAENRSHAASATSPTPTTHNIIDEDIGKEVIADPGKPVTDDEDTVESPNATGTERPSSPSKVLNTSITTESVVTSRPKKTNVSIQNFFAPRPKTQTSKENKHSSPNTYGAMLASPQKKPRIENDDKKLPLTPVRPGKKSPADLEVTPVRKQVQSTRSHYFCNDNNVSSSKDDDAGSNRSASPTSNRADYATDDEEIPNLDPPSGYYEEEAKGPWKRQETTQRTVPRVRRAYGRLGMSRLGQSRLAARTTSAQRLDFGVDEESKRSRWATQGSDDEEGSFAKRELDFKPIKNPYADKGSKTSSFFGKQSVPPKSSESEKKEKDSVEVSSSPQPPPGIPGIQNLGNTCYLSASLQTLFSVPTFLQNLYNTYESQMKTKELPLTRSLLEVAVALGVLSEASAPEISPEVAKSKLLTSKAANPSALKKQMDALTDKFAGYEQRDAHEFLSDLVDFLHDELAAAPSSTCQKSDEADKAKIDKLENRGGGTDATDSEGISSTDGDGVAKTEERSGGNETDGIKKGSSTEDDNGTSIQTKNLPTDEFFHLTVSVNLKCDCCGYSRSKEEMYRHLSVDVGENQDDPWTAERGLEQFFRPEKRDLKCEKCESGTTATQTMEVISRPKALLLHFKRFIVTQEARETNEANSEDKENKAAPVMEMVLRKNKAKISLEDSLSIDSFLDPNAEKPSSQYHLSGVVHHVGGTAFSGHYTSCSKRLIDESSQESQEPTEQWVYFDDRVGTKKTFDYVAQEERNMRNCYMALYELK